MTFQECLVLINIINVPLIPCTNAFTFYVKRDAAFSLYAYLPSAWQNGWTLGLIILNDALFSLSLGAMLIFVVHIVLLFFQKCMEEIAFNMQIVDKA